MHARAGAEVRAFPQRRADGLSTVADGGACARQLFEDLPAPSTADPEAALLEALRRAWETGERMPRLARHIRPGFDPARFSDRAQALLDTLQARARARLPAAEALAFCSGLLERALADLSRLALLLHRAERRARRRA
ncbi:MAG TPA: hypothetical protein ENK19_06315, partial [Acidobacteria bacterium]|nr:hypothetical protein [Acidobacteriota bacterium]